MPERIPPDPRPKLEVLRDRFGEISDPRQAAKVDHVLGEVLMCALCATLSGCGDGPSAIALFSNNQKDWLRSFLPLANGIPSHDTFNNVLGAVRPEAIADVLSSWVGADGKVFNIDGKVLRGSAGGEAKALCVVRAWVDGARLSAGQTACDQKSNEIEAIPRLLASLELAGSTVTIDAAGCQTAIAKQIDAAGGFYVLALKGNQKGAHDAVRAHFEELDELDGEPATSVEVVSTEEVNSGRYELRTCTVESDLEFFDKSWRWHGLTCVVRVRSEVVRGSSRGTDGAEATVEDRYYLCSCPPDAKAILALVRGHWSVENRCHWVLDVIFGEDGCRVRDVNAAHNLSMLRELSAFLYHREKERTPRSPSMKMMKLKAALDTDFRLELLQ